MNEIFFLVPNWKWLTLLGILVLGYFLQKPLHALIRNLKQKQLVVQGHAFLKVLINENIESPLSWILIFLFASSAIESLELTKGLSKYLLLLFQLALYFYLIRLSYLAANSVGVWLEKSAQKQTESSHVQLIQFTTKSLKVLVVVLGVLLVLQNLGLNVMSLLAGLGLGGLALALAAQDTAANVFGSITILLDRPFKVGDIVRVTETEGTVVEIGFRSTRIQTNENSIVTIPNAIMAKEKIDNLGLRHSRRIRHIIGLTYDTPELEMQQFIEQIKYYLLQNPDVEKNTVRVALQSLGDFSMQILVQCYLITNDPLYEAEFQEEILIEIRRFAAKIGIEFAFPTQTIQLANSTSNH